jgi:hypothetical protein
VKNGVFLGNENEYISSKKKFVGVQPFIAANKTKQNKAESKSKDTPRKTHSA